MSIVLACDLGGSSFRAALVDDQGRMLAESVQRSPVPVDEAGRSEIDPEHWWSALVQAADDLFAAEPSLFSSLRGIAICGITRTQIFLDRDGRSLRPAMTWKDTRSQAVAARLREQLGAHPEAGHLNAFHPLARISWLKEHEEAVFDALATVLEPKDWLNFRLTGERASDPVSMARLVACADPARGMDALSAVGLAQSPLPPLLEPCDQVGPVRPGLPGALGQLSGVPVFCSSNDTWAAVTGLGAMRQGFAYNISGTTEVLGLLSKEAVPAEGLLSVDWRGLWQLGGPSQNGADTAAWLAELLGSPADAGTAIDALLRGRRHPQPLLFLPYLQGERVPYWDPALRGAILGLGRQHSATDLAFAVLEGVAFRNRIVIERAEAALGIRATEIRFGGGGAANPVWAQIKADICGRPVVVGTAKEPGLLGAAIIAWTGLGQFSSLDAAQEVLVATGARHEPSDDRREAYDALFSRFRQAEAALALISTELAGLSAPNTALADPEVISEPS